MLPAQTLLRLASEIASDIPYWLPTTEPPQTLVGVQLYPPSDTIAVLNRLAAAIEALAVAHGGAGHNQGPPLVDEKLREEARAAVDQARTGVRDGAAGAPEVEKARSRLQAVMDSVGKSLIGEATKTIYAPSLAAAIYFYYHLHEVIAVLGSWLIKSAY